jgi:hypothetical protein
MCLKTTKEIEDEEKIGSVHKNISDVIQGSICMTAKATEWRVYQIMNLRCDGVRIYTCS